MKQIIKDALILFAITLISGFLLGAVYFITKAPIEAQAKLTKENAYKAVFNNVEGSLSFKNTFENSTEEFEKLAALFTEAINGYDNGQNSLDEIICVYSGAELLGYAVSVTNHEGYGGDISMTVGILNDGTVSGVSILSIAETPGLGLNAKNESFIGQFADVNTNDFDFSTSGKKYVYTKTGKTSDNEIDAITSATYTTKSVTNGVNAAVTAYKVYEEYTMNGGAR